MQQGIKENLLNRWKLRAVSTVRSDFGCMPVTKQVIRLSPEAMTAILTVDPLQYGYNLRHASTNHTSFMSNTRDAQYIYIYIYIYIYEKQQRNLVRGVGQKFPSIRIIICLPQGTFSSSFEINVITDRSEMLHFILKAQVTTLLPTGKYWDKMRGCVWECGDCEEKQ